MEMIKRYSLLIILISLPGCYSNISKKEFAYELLYKSAKDAGKKIIEKENFIIANKKIGIYNIDQKTTNDAKISNIVRDALIESFVSSRKNVLERDIGLFNFIFKENSDQKYNITSKYINTDFYNIYVNTLTISSSNNTSFIPVDLIFAYRVLDSGINYYEEDPISLNRTARTHLFYEIISSENAQILAAGTVIGNVSDTIKKFENKFLENSNSKPYSYPIEERKNNESVYQKNKLKMEMYLGIGLGWEKADDTILNYPFNFGIKIPFQKFSLNFRTKKYTSKISKTFLHWNGNIFTSISYNDKISDFSSMLAIEYSVFRNSLFNNYLLVGGGLSHLRKSQYDSNKSPIGFSLCYGIEYLIYTKTKLYLEYEYFYSSFLDSKTGYNIGLVFNF
ncbi:MAG: hypothetical protein N2Z20_03510 [Elusimicrobiales bacterium]|nr:hypothetical protein [Elusimicrobiales bacterium]